MDLVRTGDADEQPDEDSEERSDTTRGRWTFASRLQETNGSVKKPF